MAGKKSGSNKTTSPEVASAASRVLRDKRTGKDSKAVAGSALAQTPPKSPKKK